jgi:hypothetical protein
LIVEDYIGNDIKLLYELRNKELLSLNNSAKVLMESNIPINEESPSLEKLKSNEYFTFYDGSLNYSLVLKTYESIYESEEINMENLFLYFDSYNTTSITIKEVYEESALHFYIEHGSIGIAVYIITICQTSLNYVKEFINNIPKFTNLEKIELEYDSREWNPELIRKERKLPNSGNWVYLKKQTI